MPADRPDRVGEPDDDALTSPQDASGPPLDDVPVDESATPDPAAERAGAVKPEGASDGRELGGDDSTRSQDQDPDERPGVAAESDLARADGLQDEPLFGDTSTPDVPGDGDSSSDGPGSNGPGSDSPGSSEPSSEFAYRSPVPKPLSVVSLVLLGLVLLGVSILITVGLVTQLREAPPQLTFAPVERGHVDGIADPAGVNDQAAPSVVTVTTEVGGLGSGFVYRPGMIVTNWHVIVGDPLTAAQLELAPDEVTVTVTDHEGRSREAAVLGADARMDLAVLQVEDMDDLPPLMFADHDELAVGMPAYVIGSPFGIAGTMTSGQISGIKIDTAFRNDQIQTGLLMVDAAVNPGNSGGPVLTADGTAAGVVTLRPDSSGGRSVQGLALAIPSDAVLWAVDALEQGEQPPYVAIGIQGRTATPDDLTDAGAVVAAVTDTFPAHEAGIGAGDVIVAIDGIDIRSFADLVDALRMVRPDQRVQVTVVRDADWEVDGLEDPLPAAPMPTDEQDADGENGAEDPDGSESADDGDEGPEPEGGQEDEQAPDGEGQLPGAPEGPQDLSDRDTVELTFEMTVQARPGNY